jgi:choloylglycine hydrolase
MERDGSTGKNTVKWTSKHGSMTTSAWDIAVSDGMNEKGLVANMLWLVSSKYPEFEKDGTGKKGLSVSLWAQYALDNFATVAEVVEEFRKEEFVIVTDL